MCARVRVIAFVLVYGRVMMRALGHEQGVCLYPLSYTHTLSHTHTDTLKYMSVFVFSFTCHQNIFFVCNEIKDNTQVRVA
jgi:amino acid permease